MPANIGTRMCQEWGCASCVSLLCHSAMSPPGAGGVGNHDSGIPADASILVDSNNPNCPASAPTPYSPCPSERSVCVYEDGLGCSRWFICTMQVSFFAAATTGVGGSFPTNS